MIEQHHQVNGHEFAQAQGDDEEQGNLVCCRPWCLKESDMTEGVNKTELYLSR